jgi:hypothetical protein
MPECQLPGIAYGASMVVGKSSGNAVRLLSGMLINTCFRPQAVCRLSSEAAIGEAAPLRNLTDGLWKHLGHYSNSTFDQNQAAGERKPGFR